MRNHPAAPRHPERVVFSSSDDLSYAQIATAWFTLLADPRKATALLGVPALPTRIDSDVLAAMLETGADLKAMRTRLITPEVLESADLVVTLGRTFERLLLGTHAPVYREHWLIDVASAYARHPQVPSRARSLRDLIRSRVAMLVFSEGWVRADISRENARVTRPRWHNEASPAF